MPSSQLSVLVPIRLKAEAPEHAAFSQALYARWEAIRAASRGSQGPELLTFCSAVYGRIMEHYLNTLHACPLTNLARAQAKRWGALQREAGLGASMGFPDLLRALLLSGTLDLIQGTGPRGGAFYLPGIVGVTIASRIRRGEPMPNLIDVANGTSAGPLLSEVGMLRGVNPFWEPNDGALYSEHLLVIRRIEEENHGVILGDRVGPTESLTATAAPLGS